MTLHFTIPCFPWKVLSFHAFMEENQQQNYLVTVKFLFCCCSLVIPRSLAPIHSSILPSNCPRSCFLASTCLSMGILDHQHARSSLPEFHCQVSVYGLLSNELIVNQKVELLCKKVELLCKLAMPQMSSGVCIKGTHRNQQSTIAELLH